MHEIEAVEIPDADAIKALRAKINCTQAKCAKMAQVSIKTWQCWEDGTRNPSKPSWGVFLLATDKHPDFYIVKRSQVDIALDADITLRQWLMALDVKSHRDMPLKQWQKLLAA